MSVNAKTNNIRYYLICFICFFLMFFGGAIPSFSPLIPKVGMQIICLFVGMVVCGLS